MPVSPYLVSFTLTQPSAQTPTGSFYLVANLGDAAGPLTLDIPGVTPGIVQMLTPAPGLGNYGHAQTGIPPGAAYQVHIYDAGPGKLPGFAKEFTIDPAPPQTPGCTDPDATNFDGSATVENGTCTYTPRVVDALFAVPLLQTLRFVVRSGGSGAAGFDTQLFCEQPRPGQQVRPHYYQLVERDDAVRVQVLTSYPAVAATIHRHGGAQVGGAVPLTQVMTLEGPSTPLNVTLSQTPDGLTKLAASAGGNLPASLLAAKRLTLGGSASGTYRVTQAVPATVLALDDYLLLNRPWAPPGAGQVTATWQLSGPGFNVWEADLPLAPLADGYYQVRLRATKAGWPDARAESEPLYLRDTHPNTVAVDFKNADNCFNMVFATGIMPRLRLWGTFFRQKNGGTSQSYTDSASNLTVLSSTATRLTTLETYGQPAYQHEKLFLACRLDYVLVNGERCVAPAAYETDPPRAYPLAGGHVDLQKVAWLGAGNGDDLGDNAPDNALALRGGGYLLLRGR